MIMITRKQYLAGEATFHEFYGQFVTESVLRAVRGAFGKAIKASTDPHFNDTPLAAWDRLANGFRFELGSMISQANGSGGVSLSDLVCTLKAAAHRIKEEA